ncbi:MAG: threonine/serine dehydratase [Steroidobacteraceae bacterium]
MNQRDHELTRDDLPEFADVVAAADRLGRAVLRTPVLHSEALDGLIGTRTTFKCENLQYGGAFKIRGAMNAMAVARQAGPVGQVLTHSSGNHGAALARAARHFGSACCVVAPNDSAAVKLAKIRDLGARLVLCEPGIAAREQALQLELQRSPGLVVHPFDDAAVIAGQGTVALEFFEQASDLGALFVPLGGGGLISGIALVAAEIAPDCQIIGVEPQLAAEAQRSLLSGRRERQGATTTIADGLRGSIGERNFHIVKRLVRRIVTVSDAQIAAAMLLCWQELKILIEPSAAVGLAAALETGREFAPRPVGIVLSGGNVDLGQWLKAPAALQSGARVRA